MPLWLWIVAILAVVFAAGWLYASLDDKYPNLHERLQQYINNLTGKIALGVVIQVVALLTVFPLLLWITGFDGGFGKDVLIFAAASAIVTAVYALVLNVKMPDDSSNAWRR